MSALVIDALASPEVRLAIAAVVLAAVAAVVLIAQFIRGDLR